MIARAAVSPPSSNGSMSPTVVTLISIGVFVVSGMSFCVWRKLVSLGVFRSLLAYVRVPQRPERVDDCDPETSRPEIFDTWTERRTPNDLKWEEYMPLSVTAFTASEPVRKVAKLRRYSANGKAEKGRKDQEGCHLQVGVLLAMPSQLHTKNYDGVGQDLSESALRGGLAIGLVEMPWIDVDC